MANYKNSLGESELFGRMTAGFAKVCESVQSGKFVRDEMGVVCESVCEDDENAGAAQEAGTDGAAPEGETADAGVTQDADVASATPEQINGSVTECGNAGKKPLKKLIPEGCCGGKAKKVLKEGVHLTYVRLKKGRMGKWDQYLVVNQAGKTIDEFDGITAAEDLQKAIYRNGWVVTNAASFPEIEDHTGINHVRAGGGKTTSEYVSEKVGKRCNEGNDNKYGWERSELSKLVDKELFPDMKTKLRYDTPWNQLRLSNAIRSGKATGILKEGESKNDELQFDRYFITLMDGEEIAIRSKSDFDRIVAHGNTVYWVDEGCCEVVVDSVYDSKLNATFEAIEWYEKTIGDPTNESSGSDEIKLQVPADIRRRALLKKGAKDNQSKLACAIRNGNASGILKEDANGKNEDPFVAKARRIFGYVDEMRAGIRKGHDAHEICDIYLSRIEDMTASLLSSYANMKK